MPFLEPSQDLAPRGVLGVTPTEPDMSGNLAAAAARQSNSVVSFLSNARASGPFAPEPGYNPFEDIKGTPYEEMHTHHFVASQSHAETQAIMQRLNQETADRRTVANNGWMGTVASLVAGGLDPVWFLGFGARGPMALRSAFLTGARDVGAMTFKGMAAQETILGATQETRPFKESLESVASGTLLWAMIGGGAGKLLAGEGKLQPAVASLARGRAALAEHTGTVSPEVVPAAEVPPARAPAAAESARPAAAPAPAAPAVPEAVPPGAIKSATTEGSYSLPIIDKNGGGIGKLDFTTERPIDDAGAVHEVIRVTGANIKEEVRGQGNGLEAYRQLADWALSNGKEFWSDRFPSDEASRVYEALERRGYTVVKEEEPRSRSATYKVTAGPSVPSAATTLTGKAKAGAPEVVAPLEPPERIVGAAVAPPPGRTLPIQERIRQVFLGEPEDLVRFARENDLSDAQVQQHISDNFSTRTGKAKAYRDYLAAKEQQPTPSVAPEVGATMGTAGAAATDTRNLSPAPYGLEGWPRVRAIISKMWPNMDALENGAPVTQRAVAEMAETSFATKGNIAGETTTLRGGPAADREISLFRESKLSGARNEMMRLWEDYLGGKATSVAEKAQRAMGRAPEGMMTFNEFDAAVYDALHLEDAHEIPQVAAMAQWNRKQIYDAVTARAEKAIDGFKPIEPREGESYAPQIWNKELIRARWNDFVKMWADHLVGQQSVKAAIQERLGLYQGALESHEATIEKMTGRLERRRASLEEAEIKQEEVQRFNKFAFQRSEKLSKPLDELRQQIAGVTDKVQPELDKLAQLAEDIKAERVKFPEIKEADALLFKMIGAAQKLKQSKGIIDAVDAAGEYVDAVDKVISGFKGGIRESAEQAKVARRDLAPDLVALEKSRAEVKKEAEPYLKQLNQLRKTLAEERAARIEGARGGAVFETKIRERGNVIADALSGKRAEIDELETKLNDEHLRAAAVRDKIEEAIGQWEGKSAAEAKSALKARAKYEAERAAKAAAKGEAAPTERLTGADKVIDDTIKRIIEKDLDLPRNELLERARDIALRTISTPEGRLPYDEHLGGPQVGVPGPTADLRGHTAHRAIDLPYDLAGPWLDKSAVRASTSYLHSVLPDTILAERFAGDPNMTVKFKEIAEHYARALEGAKSEAEQTRLNNRRDDDMKIVAGMRDRIRGVMGYDQGSNTARIAQGALKINNIVSSHAMAIASLPDIAGTVFRHAFEQGFGRSFGAYFRGLVDAEAGEALKAQGPELRAMGIGLETERSSKQHAVDGITENYRPASQFERALTWASDKAFIVNLLSPLTDIQKRISANVAMNAILRASQAVAEGKATQRQIEDLAASNIRPDVAERIWAAYGKGGAEVKGVLLPNTADWADAEARLAFQAAVARDVDIAVVTPGQEKPFWMSKPGWNLIGQYSTFAVSATQRIMIANLQRSDAATAAGMMTAIAAGMLAYRLNTLIAGQPTSDRPQDWVKEGISRSGILGAIDNANTITSKLSGGSLDIFRAIGADKPLSRTAGRNAAEVLLGPTYGKISNLARATSAAGRMDWTEADSHALRMVFLGSNLPYLPRLFDGIEHGANAAFGIPMKTQP